MTSFASNARSEASRRNGARSRGPKTGEGKARAARNAVKHGLRAKETILLAGEDRDAFEAMEQGLRRDLQPSGALETLLAKRLTVAAWRLDRADRIEAELLGGAQAPACANLGETITRDRHGPQAVDCLLRYRGSTQSEFWRALAALRAIQGDRLDAPPRDALSAAPRPIEAPPSRVIEAASDPAFGADIDGDVTRLQPNEPETR